MRAKRAVRLLFLALALAAGVAAPAGAQNYPVEVNIEIRDASGNLVTATTPTCPEDALGVRSNGWLPTSDVVAKFFSTVHELGTFRSNGTGLVDFVFRVPQVENGLHTLQLTGTGQNGQPRTVEATILCECRRATDGTPSAVLGRAEDLGVARGGTFARTGVDTVTLLVIAFDLLAIGLTLRLAQRRTRAARLRT
jgi:hypothetical protein